MSERERRDAALTELGFAAARPMGGDFMLRSFTVCQTCGAMVALDDVEELVEGVRTERGIRLHTAWHGLNPVDVSTPDPDPTVPKPPESD